MRGCLLLLSVFLISCGYRLSEETLVSQYKSISVPYVGGDYDGRFTSALVRELARSGAIAYRTDEGQLTLCAEIVDRGTDNVGYRFETNDEGELVRRLLPDEARLTYLVEVRLIDRCQGCTLLGPFCVRASVEYPFDPLSTDNQLAVQSLGQFVDVDAAERVALTPLFDELAVKIVDYLVAAW